MAAGPLRHGGAEGEVVQQVELCGAQSSGQVSTAGPRQIAGWEPSDRLRYLQAGSREASTQTLGPLVPHGAVVGEVELSGCPATETSGKVYAAHCQVAQSHGTMGTQATVAEPQPG
ncbi:hypothetical protein JZ751_023316 [Albula glossodonta]|uniref:Uncharacterized protein n=1 Tax=Albula glossodonta TaxID=121402 RepID=A0A8T2NK79_9TELE|nr:hypothetical protein JZ751_023316 [Albula glossodonta]